MREVIEPPLPLLNDGDNDQLPGAQNEMRFEAEINAEVNKLLNYINQR